MKPLMRLCLVMIVFLLVSIPVFGQNVVKYSQDVNLLTNLSAYYVNDDSIVVELDYKKDTVKTLDGGFEGYVTLCPKDYGGDVWLFNGVSYDALVPAGKLSDVSAKWCADSVLSGFPVYEFKFSSVDVLDWQGKILRLDNKPHYFEIDFYVGNGTSKYTVTNLGGDDDNLTAYYDCDSIESGDFLSDYAGTNDSLSMYGTAWLNTTDYIFGGASCAGTLNSGYWRRAAVSFAVENTSNIYEHHAWSVWVMPTAATAADDTFFSMDSQRNSEWTSQGGVGSATYKLNDGSNYGDNTFLTGSNFFTTGQWINIMMYYNGTHENWYRNGTLFQSEARDGYASRYDSNIAFPNQYYDGYDINANVDDVCFWDNVNFTNTTPMNIFLNATMDNLTCFEWWDCETTGDSCFGATPPAGGAVVNLTAYLPSNNTYYASGTASVGLSVTCDLRCNASWNGTSFGSEATVHNHTLSVHDGLEYWINYTVLFNDVNDSAGIYFNVSNPGVPGVTGVAINLTFDNTSTPWYDWSSFNHYFVNTNAVYDNDTAVCKWYGCMVMDDTVAGRFINTTAGFNIDSSGYGFEFWVYYNSTPASDARPGHLWIEDAGGTDGLSMGEDNQGLTEYWYNTSGERTGSYYDYADPSAGGQWHYYGYWYNSSACTHNWIHNGDLTVRGGGSEDCMVMNTTLGYVFDVGKGKYWSSGMYWILDEFVFYNTVEGLSEQYFIDRYDATRGGTPPDIDLHVKSVAYDLLDLVNWSSEFNELSPAGTTLPINITLENYGVSAAGAFDWGVLLGLPNGSLSEVCSDSEVGLAAGTELVVYCNWNTDWGLWTGKIVVDINDTVVEDVEFNNNYTIWIPYLNRPWFQFNLTEWDVFEAYAKGNPRDNPANASWARYDGFGCSAFSSGYDGNNIDPYGKKARECAMICLINDYDEGNSNCVKAKVHLEGWLNRTVTSYTGVQAIHELAHLGITYDLMFPNITESEARLYGAEYNDIAQQIYNIDGIRPDQDSADSMEGDNGKGFGSGMGTFTYAGMGVYSQNPSMAQENDLSYYVLSNMVEGWMGRDLSYLKSFKDDEWHLYQEHWAYKFYSQNHLADNYLFEKRYGLNNLEDYDNALCSLSNDLLINVLDNQYSSDIMNFSLGQQYYRGVSNGDSNSYDDFGTRGFWGWGYLPAIALLCDDANTQDSMRRFIVDSWNFYDVNGIDASGRYNYPSIYLYPTLASLADNSSSVTELMPKVIYDNAEDVFVMRDSYEYDGVDSMLQVDGGEERGGGHAQAQGYYLYALGESFIDYEQVPYNDDVRAENFKNGLSMYNYTGGSMYNSACNDAEQSQYYGGNCDPGSYPTDYPEYREMFLNNTGDLEDYVGTSDALVGGVFVWRPQSAADTSREFFVKVGNAVVKRSSVGNVDSGEVYHNFIGIYDHFNWSYDGVNFSQSRNGKNMNTSLVWANDSLSLVGGDSGIRYCFAKTSCSGYNQGLGNYSRLYWLSPANGIDMIHYHYWYYDGAGVVGVPIVGGDRGVSLDGWDVVFDTDDDGDISYDGYVTDGWGLVRSGGVSACFNCSSFGNGSVDLFAANVSVSVVLNVTGESANFTINTFGLNDFMDVARPVSVVLDLVDLDNNSNFSVYKDGVLWPSNFSDSKVEFNVTDGSVLGDEFFILGSGVAPFVPDTTAPVITIVNPVNGTNLSHVVVSVALNYSTNEVANCSLNGSLINFTGGLLHYEIESVVVGGHYEYNVSCSDAALNPAELLHEFWVNVTPAAVNLTAYLPSNNTYYASGTGSVGLSVSCDLRCNATWNGTSFGSEATVHNHTLSVHDGLEYWINYTVLFNDVNDSAGIYFNVSNTPAVVPFLVTANVSIDNFNRSNRGIDGDYNWNATTSASTSASIVSEELALIDNNNAGQIEPMWNNISNRGIDATIYTGFAISVKSDDVSDSPVSWGFGTVYNGQRFVMTLKFSKIMYKNSSGDLVDVMSVSNNVWYDVEIVNMSWDDNTGSILVDDVLKVYNADFSNVTTAPDGFYMNTGTANVANSIVDDILLMGIGSEVVWNSPTPGDGVASNAQVSINFSCDANYDRYWLWFDTNSEPVTAVLSESAAHVYATVVGGSDTFYYKGACYNSTTGALTYNSTVRSWTYDVENPVMVLGGGNGFNADNFSLENQWDGVVSLVSNVTDNDAVYAFSVNISRGGETFYNFSVEGLTVTKYNFSEAVNSSNWTAGVYDVEVLVADGHTKHEIKSYDVQKSSNEVVFDTAEGNVVKVKSDDGAVISTEKLKDRYEFGFDFGDGEVKDRNFVVEASDSLVYLRDSPFKAHFVVWNGKEGNWIDFEGVSGSPVISKINDSAWNVRFRDAPSKLLFKSIGGLNVVSFNYSFYQGEYSITAPTGLLGSNVTIILNMSRNSTTISNMTALFYYDGSLEPGTVRTFSDDYVQWDTSVAADSPGDNITFYWLVNVTQADSNWTNFSINGSHASLGWGIDNCSNSTNVTLWLNVFDEDEPTLPVIVDMEVEASYWVDDVSLAQTFYGNFSGSNSYALCLTPSDAELRGDLYVRYSGDFLARYYLTNDSFSNVTRNVSLYAYNTSDTISDVVVNIKDLSNYVSYPGVYTKLQRRYSSEGVWRTVQMDLSSDDGSVLFNVREETTDYKLTFLDYDENVLDVTDVWKFVCTDTRCELDYLISPFSSSFGSELVVSPVYDNVTGNFSVSWNDDTGVSSSVKTWVTKETLSSSLVLCELDGYGSNGSYSCGIGGHTGNIVYTILADTEGVSEFVMVGSLEDATGGLATVLSAGEGAFWTFGIVVVIAGAGVASPFIGLIAVVFGLLAAMLLKLNLFITLPVVMIAAVVSIAIGIKVRNRG